LLPLRSKSRSAHSPYVDSDDVVWFGDNDGLCRLNSDGKIETFPIKHLLKRFSIGAIIEDEKGIIWIGTIQGLYSFNKQTHIFKRYLFDTGGEEANSITCLIQDRERNIWVGSWGNGIAKFDRQTGKFEIYKYSVEENIVWSIYESSEQDGKLWVRNRPYQWRSCF
jgi:ligand-binding sensor domain-containing protein